MGKQKLRITWQRDILAAMLSDLNIVRRSRGIVKPIYFSSIPYRWLCKKIYDHYERYDGEKLSKRSLLIELKKYVREKDERRAYRKSLLPLYKHHIKSKAHVIDSIHEWAETQSFALVLKKSAELGEEGNLVKAKEVITSSFLFDIDRKNYIIRDFTEQWEERQKLRRSLKNEADAGARKKIIFNLGPLDNVCQIFVDTSSLVIFAATSGVGKSIFSVNIGANCFLNDMKVAHFIFENVVQQLEGRYDSRVLGIPYRSLMNYNWNAGDLKRVQIAMKKFKKKFKSNLMLFHFPIDTCSVPIAEGVLRELEIANGWIPDVIIYDSLDHMLPSVKKESHRLNVAKVYADAKRQSEIRSIPVITTSHLKAQERNQLGKMEGFSESYDKARLSDVWITINQTIEQEDDHQAIVYLDKNRDDEGNLKILVDLLYHVMLVQFNEVVE